MSSTVKDVMTTRVVAVRRGASFKEMVAMLRRSRISAFPVVDEQGRVIGVVSEADMLIKEADQAASRGLLAGLWHHLEHDKSGGVTAGDLMTTPPLTIGPDAPVAQAARLMYDHQVKRLPVVNQTRHLIGIVSRADVLSVFTRPDEEIAREVTSRANREGSTAGTPPYKVTVRDGIVSLSGRPQTDQIGRDIVEAVRHVEGVIAVRDRLSYPGDHRESSP